VRNSGFEFPLDRVLISLAPASLKKEGSSYDLPIALAILGASGALPEPGFPFLALGELGLDGELRPARAVLPAVAAALAAGIERFIVPLANRAEAAAFGRGAVYPMERLSEAVAILASMRSGDAPPSFTPPAEPSHRPEADLADLRGLARVRRALEIAAAGGHNLLLFGPPGSGKTLAARRLPSLLPDLAESEAIAATSLHSIAGLLPRGSGLLRRPPFRAPHHSSSLEGLVGGGRPLRPGEISLSHAGVLFLDEAPEFRRDALQALREPIEEGRVGLARAGSLLHFPAEAIVILAANPCPCGNLGREGRICVCGPEDLKRYWRRLGGPLLDRIDLRIPVRPADPRDLLGPAGESSATVRERVAEARLRQARRYAGQGFSLNARIPAGLVEKYCRLSPSSIAALSLATERLSLSSRAAHSILKAARSIADLADRDQIEEEELLEAIQHRRYGDGDFFWQET
jgi:magnesium chelatase family protein